MSQLESELHNKPQVIVSSRTDSGSTTTSNDTAISKAILCSWCHRPRSLFTAEIVSKLDSDNGDVPVCCSQICFDQLRRAQFKRRRCNPRPIDPVQSMLVSGRPPYFPYSHSGTREKHVFSNTMVPGTSQNLRSIQQGLRRRLPRVMSSDNQQTSLTIATKMQNTLFANNYASRHEEDIQSQTSSFNFPQSAMSNVDNSPPHSEALENGERSLLMSTFSPQSSSSLLELLYSWFTYTQTAAPPVSQSVNMHKDQPSASQHGTQLSTPNIILPVFLPVFKNAPEILDILQRHGYHSASACHLGKFYSDACTQTLPDTQQAPHPSILPAHIDSGNGILDLRIPKPEYTSLTASSYRNKPKRVLRCGTWYRMIDVKSNKLVKFVPVSSKNKRRGKIEKWCNKRAVIRV